VKTTGSGSQAKQELLCVGIDRTLSLQVVENLESVGAEVVAVTVPLYASIRAFDKLYRRDGDEKITSMLIDMDEQSSMVMIAHGANCVFAHRIESDVTSTPTNEWKAKTETIQQNTLTLSTAEGNEFERRNENNPRGLRGIQGNGNRLNESLAGELERCLRHHDALFPDRVVDRVIFAGCGANDTEYCSSIASELGISGFVADPSEWMNDSSGLAGGPMWTTAAGLCLRYSENVA
jgi:Tfp pilus assembly PilM family ATPase